MNKKRSKNKIAEFFKKLGLLFRCIISSLSFAMIWIGITLIPFRTGIILIVVGSLLTVVSIYYNVIVPVIKLK